MKTTIDGQLEIDHERGVIYFHATEGPLAGASVLRLCRLPTPVPRDEQLDVTHMHGCSWRFASSNHKVRAKEKAAFDAECGL